MQSEPAPSCSSRLRIPAGEFKHTTGDDNMPDRQTNPADLTKLNRQQRKAVTYGVKKGAATLHKPLLIVAGAGTGKTKVMAERIAYLVARGVNPDNILAFVF